MKNEIIWKTLVYNGETYNQFEVSNNGQLRNIKTGTVYKQTLNKKGYYQVCVSLGSRNKKKIFRIHRAVAEVFILNPNNKEEVNHKDGNKKNNHVTNLEWATSSENIRHAYKYKLMVPYCGTDNSQAKLTKEDVIYIRDHYISGDREYGSRALGRKFNVHHSIILNIINSVSYVNV